MSVNVVSFAEGAGFAIVTADGVDAEFLESLPGSDQAGASAIEWADKHGDVWHISLKLYRRLKPYIADGRALHTTFVA